MIQELLKNPAFAELYKNAPQLNNIEVPKLETGGFVQPMPVVPPIVQTPIILPAEIINNTAPKKSKGGWVLLVLILVGGMVALYKISRFMQPEADKSKNNKN
jgi:hypothetical protein